MSMSNEPSKIRQFFFVLCERNFFMEPFLTYPKTRSRGFPKFMGPKRRSLRAIFEAPTNAYWGPHSASVTKNQIRLQSTDSMTTVESPETFTAFHFFSIYIRI